jgi:hypothetical protein
MSILLGEQYKLQLFITEIFRSKKDEINDQFRLLHNKELCELCRSPVLLGYQNLESSDGGEKERT